ncbi:MAG: MerR family transcriptional regulator [Gemmiger formicilis]
MAYTVGEMARRLGVPASTIRYYDKEGLLPFVGRSSGGIRVFTEKDFEWLRIIECLKKDRHVPQGHPRIHRAGHAGR